MRIITSQSESTNYPFTDDGFIGDLQATFKSLRILGADSEVYLTGFLETPSEIQGVFSIKTAGSAQYTAVAYFRCTDFSNELVPLIAPETEAVVGWVELGGRRRPYTWDTPIQVSPECIGGNPTPDKSITTPQGTFPAPAALELSFSGYCVTSVEQDDTITVSVSGSVSDTDLKSEEIIPQRVRYINSIPVNGGNLLIGGRYDTTVTVYVQPDLPDGVPGVVYVVINSQDSSFDCPDASGTLKSILDYGDDVTNQYGLPLDEFVKTL